MGRTPRSVPELRSPPVNTVLQQRKEVPDAAVVVAGTEERARHASDLALVISVKRRDSWRVAAVLAVANRNFKLRFPNVR